jgi:hypothetical protein
VRAPGWALACAALVACHHASDERPGLATLDCEPLSLGAKPTVLGGKPVLILVYESSRFRLERTEGATVAKELDSDAVGLLVERDPIVLHFTDMRCHKRLVARMSKADPSDVRVDEELDEPHPPAQDPTHL